jgi:methyltransferase
LSPVLALVLLVAAQRLAELAIAARNTRRLLARGAVEHGRGHYPLIVLLHVAWLAGLPLLVPADRWPHALPIALFLLLQPVRLWILLGLGGRWTTRIIVLPGAPLVRGGPYRWLSHPNYVVVACEIALLPLAFGAVLYAVIFSALNLALLSWRVRVENRALAAAARPTVDEPGRPGPASVPADGVCREGGRWARRVSTPS